VRRLAGRGEDVDRASGHVGDHDGSVGGLAFDLGRPRIGVRLRAVVAFRKQLCLQLRDHVAVFRVHERQCAQGGAALEGSASTGSFCAGRRGAARDVALSDV